MIRKLTGAVLLTGMLAGSAVGQDPKAVLADAAKAMGAQSLTSITYTGTVIGK